jgi:hypothetical protein
LKKAFDICSKTHYNYEKIVLYFMTDGRCKYYPEKSINNFAYDKTFKNKIVFYSVGFGHSKSLMERMAD